MKITVVRPKGAGILSAGFIVQAMGTSALLVRPPVLFAFHLCGRRRSEFEEASSSGCTSNFSPCRGRRCGYGSFSDFPFQLHIGSGRPNFFQHLGSFITIEHHLTAPQVHDLDFEHQHLQLNPCTGALNDPFEVASELLPMLRLSREPASLVTGFENYLLGVFESKCDALN